MPHSRQKVDLNGQRFGKLTVLGPAENIGNRTAWLCRCDYTKAGGLANSLTYVDGTCVEMLQAKTVRKNNTSGVPGVDWRKSKGKWRASICFKGKRYYLGSYSRFEDAVKARKKAEDEMHDEFLRQFAETVKRQESVNL